MIELKKLEDTVDSEKDELYRWAKLIAASDWELINMTAKGNPYFEKKISEIDLMDLSENERYIFLRESMAYTDFVSQKETAWQEGYQNGYQKGLEEGLWLVRKIRGKLAKGKSVEKIADELEEDVITIQTIVDGLKNAK